MSGPKTAQYDIAAEMLARLEAEREAQARADAQRREQERRRREAQNERLASARAAADEAERRIARLERLARSAGRPLEIPASTAPVRSDSGSLERYASALGGEAAKLEAELRSSLSQAAQRLGDEALARLAKPKTAAELLDAFAAQARLAAPDAERPDAERRRERARRILGRLSNDAAGSIPADMEALMAEMIVAQSEVRAEALALELQLRVQRHNEERARREREVAESRELLASLPEARACDAVRQDLELAVAGLAPLDAALRGRVREALAANEADLARERRQAASQVLEETLQDLGYAVEGIENTLFVEGGVAHFNKAEWGEYCVRLRVDPAQQTVNFNMVREPAEGDAAGHSAADQAAELSWCSGLPQLLKTLEARGLPMKLKRQIAAGAMPVQVVEPGAIPEELKVKAGRQGAAPGAHTLKRP